jgi:hypothetical protein
VFIDGCIFINPVSDTHWRDTTLQHTGCLIVKDTLLIGVEQARFRNTIVVEEDEPMTSGL